MSVNEKLMVTVDVAGDISKFQSSIKTIQTELGKLQLPNNLKEGFGQIFNSLNREIEKVQGIAGKKKIDLVDQKQLQKSFSAIENYYNRLVNKMQSSKIKTSLFAKDEKVLSQINSLLTTYNNKVNANAATQKKLNKELDAAQKAYDKINAKPGSSDEVKAVNNNVKALKEQVEAAKALEKVKAEALAQKETDPSVKVIKATKAYKEHEAAVKAVKEAEDALNAAKAQQPELKAEAEQAALERVKNTLEQAQQAVDKFNAAQAQIETSAWEKLKTDLQGIEGIDWQKIGIDPNAIKSAEDLEVALERIKNVASSSTGGVFGTINEETKTASASLTEMGRKAEQTAQSLLELGNRQNDIQQLASRLTHFFSLTNQFMIMRRIIQNAITTIKELDKAMTETAVVTKFDVSDMWAQLPEYTKVANELGATTKGAYETMTLFYQQGLDQQQAFQLGTETMKMARIAGLDYAEATDRMTNALRGFNMELNDVSSQRVNDVYSNLAAKSASNVDELSTAMTKTASIAHAANMEFETTAAFLAQIIETTRESAETAGTALKTVIARFSEVKKLYSEGELTGQDEEGEEINVNRVSTALRAAGVDLNEYLVGAKGLDEVFIELASKWDNLDLVTQRYIATMAAGSRQQSRFIALMQDYGRQTELVGYAQNAAGASTEQFNKTLDSLEAKLNKLENAWNEFTMGIANSSLIKGAIDLITGLITAINKLTGALGPVGGAITKVLLLFAGFKGIKTLFDRFIGYIAKTYVNAAKAASNAGANAGEKYAQGFFASSKKSLNKIKNIFVDVKGIKNSGIDASGFQQAQASLQKYTEAQRAAAAAQKVYSDEATQGFAKMAAAEKVLATAQEEEMAMEEARIALNNIGITNEEVQNGIITQKINLFKMLEEAESEEAFIKEFSATVTEKEIIADEAEAKALAKKIWLRQQETAVHGSLLKKAAATIMVLFGVADAEHAVGAAGLTGTIGVEALQKSLENLQKAVPQLWTIIAIIAAVSAAVALAVRANEEFSLEGKIKDLEGVSKSLDDELKAVQDRLDQFDEHTSAIEEITDTLNEATIGTNEWKNAVADLNHEYIELSKIIGSDFWNHVQIVNGRIVPEEGYIETARQEAQDQEQSLKNQGYAIDATLQQFNLQKELEDFSKESATKVLLGQFNEEKYKQQIEEYKAKVLETSQQVDATFQLMGSSLEDDSVNLGAYSKIVQSSYKSALKDNENLLATLDFFGTKNVELSKQYAEIMNKSYQGVRQYEVDALGNISYLDLETQERHDDESSISQIYERVMYDSLQNQDTGTLYKETLQTLVNGIEEATNETIDESLIEKILAGDYTYEDVKNLGPEIWSAINDTFEKNNIPVKIEPVLMEDGSDAIKKDIENLISEAKINVNFDDLTSATNQKGIKAFTDLFNTKISSNKNDFANLFMGLDDFTDAEEFAQVMEHLSSIDFSNKADWEALPKWLEDAGIKIPDSELQTFINKCEELAHAIDKIDFTKIEEQLGVLYSSLDKLRSGDIDSTKIDEDTYKALIESEAVDAKDFRKNLATGEYVYIQGQDSLETAIYAAITALDNNAEAQLEANVKANEIIENYFTDDQQQQLQKDLSDPGKQRAAIAEIVSQWKKSGLNIDNLGIENLNNSTNINDLTPEQRESIATAITSVILNGIEGARAQQEQYQNNVNYTEAVDRGQQMGYSFMGNDTFSADATDTAFKSLENYDAQLQQTKDDYKELTNELDDNAWKKLTVDLADADKKGKKLAETFEKNREALQDINNADYQTAFKELNSAMGDIFGKDVFDEGGDFLRQNIDDILEYAETGSEETAERIEQNIAQRQLMIGLGLDAEPAMEVATEVANEIDGWEAEIDVTGYADVTDIINKFASTQEEIDAVARSIETLGDLEVVADVKMSSARLKITNMGALNSALTSGATGGEAAAAALKKLNGLNGASVEYPEMSYKVVKGGGSKLGNLRKGGSGSGGGGGSNSGKDEEPEDNRDWKNPYDELYKAYSDLEKLQRKRNEYEKEYNLLLGQAGKTSLDLTAELQKQTDNIKEQMAIQEDLIEGKKAQIDKLQDKTYSVEDGTVKSFKTAFTEALNTSIDSHSNVPDAVKNSKLSDYGYWDDDAQEARINWDLIQSLEGTVDSAVGEIVEAYISELEGLEDQVQEANDALLDLKTDLKQLIEETLENRVAFIEEIREAMIDEYQKQIDALSTLNEAINDSNSRIFDALQQQIDLERQIRDNTKTEEDIAANEAKLAYLQLDTSGASDLEILQLQKTLEEQRQNYSDKLIDQELARLQDQADHAAQQREDQIALMDAQLQFWTDTGWWNDKIEALSDADAQALVEKFKDYTTKTKDEQAQIRKDVTTLVQQGGNEAAKSSRELAAARSEFGGQSYTATYNGQTYSVSYNSSKGGWVGTKGSTSIFIKEADATNVDNDKHTFTASAATLTDTSKKDEPKQNTVPATPATPSVQYYKKPSKTDKQLDYSIVDALKNIGVDSSFATRAKIAAANDIKNYKGTAEQNRKLRDLLHAGKLKKYARGGLADYTGPAWLDGTPSKPEMVLSAKDTQNFIDLKDILSDVMRSTKDNVQSSGDNYFDIKIEVGEIGSDYDVDKMIDKIKQEIDADARYRNVNSINFIR